MGIGSRVWALFLFGVSRPIIAGLAFGFALLLTAQAGLAQPSQPAPGTRGSESNSRATSRGHAKEISAARGAKCRTKSVQDLIELLKAGLPTLEWEIVENRRSAETWQEIPTTKESEGAPADTISALKNVIKVMYNFISDLTNEVNQQRSDIKSLEAKPPCPESKSAAQPPPNSPPPAPGGFGALPPCGDVSAEIKSLTQELTKLSKEETSLEATLAKHTSDYNAAVKEYPSQTIVRNGGSSSWTTDDPRVESARSAVEADQKRVDDNRAKIKADKDRIVALYGVPPCPEPPKTAGPPPTAPPCYSGANAAQIAAEIAAYQAELDRLTAEYIKLSASPGTGPAMLKNATESAELEKKIGALKDIRPCPDPTRTATPPGPPPGANPPSDNEHGMAPTMPGNSGFGFGFGGGGFGFGGGSDEGQRDRGFGDRNRRP
jgi:hypothetical protein